VQAWLGISPLDVRSGASFASGRLKLVGGEARTPGLRFRTIWQLAVLLGLSSCLPALFSGVGRRRRHRGSGHSCMAAMASVFAGLELSALTSCGIFLTFAALLLQTLTLGVLWASSWGEWACQLSGPMLCAAFFALCASLRLVGGRLSLFGSVPSLLWVCSPMVLFPSPSVRLLSLSTAFSLSSLFSFLAGLR
jgi:hypothetical protein